MDEKQAQLEWEARAGRTAAYLAWLGAALIIASLVYRIVALPHGADNVKGFLPQVKTHKGEFLVSGILTAVAMLAFVPPLMYLFRVTSFRRSELPNPIRWLVIFGPILFAVCSVWFQFRQAHAADVFLAGANKTNKHAESVLRDATTAVAGLSLAASVATGFATIMVSLHAMRAGLFSRFMGVLGIILGALFVLPLVASPVIQLFWLTALGALFIGNWPGGRGPAWDSGEAIPWPSPQRGIPREADDEEPEAEDDPAAEAAPTPTPNPRASRKRKKRKARR